MPSVPLQAFTLLAFAAFAYFEVSVGHWTDFMLGMIWALLLLLAWSLKRAPAR